MSENSDNLKQVLWSKISYKVV